MAKRLQRWLRRGELARRTGCNGETIRYYERIGLLCPPARSDGGHRLYSDRDRARLGFVLRARELGFSIDEIRSLLGMVDSDGHACAEINDLTRLHLASVRARIEDLQRLERTLSAMASRCGERAAPRCPIVEALSSGHDIQV